MPSNTVNTVLKEVLGNRYLHLQRISFAECSNKDQNLDFQPNKHLNMSGSTKSSVKTTNKPEKNSMLPSTTSRSSIPETESNKQLLVS